MVDGVIYTIVPLRGPSIDISEDEISGRITSTVTGDPIENNQMSIADSSIKVMDMPYVRRGNGLLIPVFDNGAWTWFVPADEYSALLHWPAYYYPISMIIQGVAPNGISFVLENVNENSEFTFGEDYALYVWKYDTWEPIEPILDNWAFNDVSYTIPPWSRTDVITVDWECLHGELPYGRYLFRKAVFGDVDLSRYELNRGHVPTDQDGLPLDIGSGRIPPQEFVEQEFILNSKR
jgi:hypothetical protein